MKYLLHYCFFILIVFVFAYINSRPKKEPFTSTIRGIYRPIIRRTRLAAEGFQEEIKKKYTESMDNLARSLGFTNND
jgi:hypothetical protein